MTEVVTRFAPSPTGLLHLGNVRTALLNWLYARRHRGRFLLRFEDTDRDRSREEYIRAIQEDLRWLGLDWDGEARFQSAHAEQHRQALERLAADGLAYRCFCSESQLHLDRRLATSRGLPPRYQGRCRNLSAKEAESRAKDEPFVWRLAVHADAGEVRVHDALRGDVVFRLADLDDPVIVRSDGSFTFLLPNAVDDTLDGITHVLRGDDHLTNSAYQVWLLQKLGHRPPVYLHHGLLLGQDGAKLSKRSGSHSVAELRGAGLLPEALIQAMVRLGHPNIDEDALAMKDLLSAFDAGQVSTSAVRWSDEEMWRWHARLLHALPGDRLLAMVREHLPDTDAAFVELVRPNLQRVQDAAAFVRLLQADAPLALEALAIAREAGASFYAAALQCWRNLDSADWKAWTACIREETGCAGRALFLPLRVALTGMTHGPEMSAVVAYLGREGVAARIENVQEQL